MLTYNLMVSGDTGNRPVYTDEVPTAAELLESYLTTPTSRCGAPAETPTRMAYLLDHEYPQRGLAPRRLKGAGAGRQRCSQRPTTGPTANADNPPGIGA